MKLTTQKVIKENNSCLDIKIEELTKKHLEQEKSFLDEINELTKKYEDKIQVLKVDKHSRISELNNQLALEKENIDLYK